ncbi:hypothetical protein F5146DRAFT_1015404 [Armillaria mellea]|nr:hypothetical protein F5146DRAFT_1015404 [Armillaria mellea]
MHVLLAAALFVLDFDNNTCRTFTYLLPFLSPNNERENTKIAYKSWRCYSCDVLICDCCVDARNLAGLPQLNTMSLESDSNTACLACCAGNLGHQLALSCADRNVFLVPRLGIYFPCWSRNISSVTSFECFSGIIFGCMFYVGHYSRHHSIWWPPC